MNDIHWKKSVNRYVFFSLFLMSLHWALGAFSYGSNSGEKREVPAKSNLDMILVPAGKFIMGSNDFSDDEQPEHVVYLDDFLIDRFEATAEEFSEFLNAQGNPSFYYFYPGKYSTIEKRGDHYSPKKGFENFPANEISWNGAMKYCRWKGKRLPTEAEWEKASRGTDGRMYPWGNEPPDETRTLMQREWKGIMETLVPVDAYPKGRSPYGVYNMAGNVWEWVSDWYYKDYYRESPARNPRGPFLDFIGFYRSLRGGSWGFNDSINRCSKRDWDYPLMRLYYFGCRCAKSP